METKWNKKQQGLNSNDFPPIAEWVGMSNLIGKFVVRKSISRY